MMEAVTEKVELQKYSEYKDSGVEWLGEIPKHWNTEKAKYLWEEKADLANTEEHTLLSVSQYTGIGINKEESRSDSLIGYKKVDEDDLVINIMLAWLGGLGLSPYSGVVSPAYAVYKLVYDADPKFLHYLYRTKTYLAEFARKSTGVVPSRWRMYTDNFGQVLTLLPPKEEQTAIAHFLDRKTEQIDQAIEIKQKQIELLKERRQILIHKAVTRGLNPNVPLKPSGVDWIGDIPEHWEVKKVKFLSRVKRGASPRPIDNPIYFDEKGKYSWVRISDVSASNHYLETTVQRLSSLGASKSVKLYPGELFISIAGTVGQPIITRINCCIHDGFVYFPDLTENVEYLYRVFESGRPYLGLGKHGTQLNLNTDTIGNIKIPIPPDMEKQKIVKHLNDETASFDKNISLVQVQIEKLKEFKTTLINSAVTGKIKVS